MKGITAVSGSRSRLTVAWLPGYAPEFDAIEGWRDLTPFENARDAALTPKQSTKAVAKLA